MTAQLSKVSVIMPCYNSAEYIAESIMSVLSQTYENFELLICDDNSLDDSYAIILGFAAQDSRIKALQNSHSKGAPGARNTCIDHASGDFFAFLDSDDLWIKTKLEKHLNFMLANNVSFSYSYNNVINEDGDFLCFHKAPHIVDSKKMCFANFIACSTAIYDARVVGPIYQPTIKKRNDFALWLSILNGGVISDARCFPEVTSCYRANSYGLSSSRLDAARYFCRCLIEFNGSSRIQALLFLAIYLPLIVLKKKWPVFYNWLVVRIF